MELIQTKDYILLLDLKAEIKGKGLRVDLERNSLGFIDSDEYYNRSENKDKFGLVIAYYPITKDAQELDLPLLPNPFKKEVDIEKLACNIYNLSLDEYEYINENLSQNRNLIEEHYKDINREEIAERYFDVISFIAGYNAAQSKQFSLEDMKKAIDLTQQICDRNAHYVQRDRNVHVPMITIDEEEEIIQSLSTQQLPKEFIPEYEIKTGYSDWMNDRRFSKKILKTITNSEDKEEFVGTYKY